MTAPLDILSPPLPQIARPTFAALGVADLAPGARVAVAMSGGVDSS
jgi:hypothetical protein